MNYSFTSQRMEIWDFAGLPFSLQVILVDSEPRVGHFLAAAGKTSPPADALPAAEAAPADSPHVHSLGFGFFS